MSKEIDVMKIYGDGERGPEQREKQLTLEQERAIHTSSLSGIRFTDGGAVGGGVRGCFFGVENLLRRHDR